MDRPLLRAFPVAGAVLLLAALAPSMAMPVESPAALRDLPLDHLEDRLDDIDSELQQLANLSMRSGLGSIGYRSKAYADGAHTEWIDIDLGVDESIDQVILVPAIWRDTKSGFKADGFPLEFRIVVGTAAGGEGTVVASYGTQDSLLPRIAPLVISFPEMRASWVRLEATALSPRAWDGKYLLQLAEILVFNDQENVALNRPIRASSPAQGGSARHERFLVDGFVPYLMDAARGDQSAAFVGQAGADDQPSFSFDLGEIQLVNGLNLHATDVSDTVPRGSPQDFGMPRRLLLEGAKQADFSDAVPLVEYWMESFFDIGPIIMRRFPDVSCRYVRLTAVEPDKILDRHPPVSFVGLAEIEIFSAGRNVSISRVPDARFVTPSPERSLTALTDGRNLYGDILPIRAWMGQLARRHDLETRRPFVLAQLDLGYERQKINLTKMRWLTVLLAAGIIVILLIARILRLRQVAGIRERLAADLHDELGANMHTIGLLSSLAEKAKDNPGKQSVFLRRIRSETGRSGNAVRRCSDMLEANGSYTNLAEDMRRAARRIMAELAHSIVIEGEDHLNQLKPRTCFDLYLFYKECLVNISRHAEATEFRTCLTASDKELKLTVSDNGLGLQGPSSNTIPSSLARRARLLGARVTAESLATGGACIVLELRTRRWGFRK